MNKKTFQVEINGEDKKFAVVRPNQRIQNQATLVYNKAFREAVEAGSIVRKKLDSELRRQNLWDDEKQAEYTKLRKRLLDNEIRLAKGGIKLVEAAGIAKQMMQDREDFRELNRDRNDLDQKTAEAYAENVRFNFLVSACTVDAKNGNPYFPSFKEYEERENDPVAVPAANALGTLLYNLDDDFEKKLPENRFLQKYGFMDDQFRLVNKEGKLVDFEGRLVNEKGQLVNEQGQLVDIDGNLIDEEGEYIVEFSPFLDDEGNPVVTDENNQQEEVVLETEPEPQEAITEPSPAQSEKPELVAV